MKTARNRLTGVSFVVLCSVLLVGTYPSVCCTLECESLVQKNKEVHEFVLQSRGGSLGIHQFIIVLVDFVQDRGVGVSQVTEALAEGDVTTGDSAAPCSLSIIQSLHRLN